MEFSRNALGLSVTQIRPAGTDIWFWAPSEPVRSTPLCGEPREGTFRTAGFEPLDPLNPIRPPNGPNYGKKQCKSLVGRTICNSCVKPMLTAAALNRHKNRPNRHTNRPKMRAGDLLVNRNVRQYPVPVISAWFMAFMPVLNRSEGVR